MSPGLPQSSACRPRLRQLALCWCRRSVSASRRLRCMSRLDFRSSQHWPSLSPVSRWQRDHEGSRRCPTVCVPRNHRLTLAARHLANDDSGMRRRTLFPLAGSAMLYAAWPAAEPAAPLLSAPIELRGDWGASPERAVSIVLTRARDACLSDVRLVSDRQPAVLRVDEHTDGPPHIWLHRAEPSVAWIIVDIGPLDWCKLAYQFGHELGHVLANSWGADAAPRNPSQWLEEALVESFSIRGLGRLADGWAAEPPFAGNAAFADAIRRYRQDILERYAAVAAEQGGTGNLSAWFRVQRAALEDNGSIG